MHGLYQNYAHPLARVVQGLPISWDPVTTAPAGDICCAAWSQCNRFIAVATPRVVHILDAVTLGQVNTFDCPGSFASRWVSFSLNSHFLTWLSRGEVTSWDLQTGSPLSTIFSELQPCPTNTLSSTYSMDEKMFAILYKSESHHVIATYNLFSGKYTNSHCVQDGYIIAPIWTHGEHLWFTVVRSGSVTIWEAGFTLSELPTEVETLPVPDEISDASCYLFFPTLSRLAFTLQDKIAIWDAKSSMFLLNSGPISLQSSDIPPHLYDAVFSSDGHFFICLTSDREVYVWKESLTCYLLHQKLAISGIGMFPQPFVSPNGRSAMVIIESMIHLWHTIDQIPFSTCTPIYHPFTLGFSPQNEWAAFAQHRGKTVTVLHLQSGNPQLAIHTDMDVQHLGLTESTIVIVGKNKVETYSLPARNSTSNNRMDIGGVVQAIALGGVSEVLSISSNLNYIACQAKELNDYVLEIYEMSMGKCILNATLPTSTSRAWFTLDGNTVWVEDWDDQLSGWEIIQDGESCVTKLEPLEQHVSTPTGPPWESSTCGYQIVDDVWVLSPTQKRLLWLPPHWRTDGDCRVWNGNFLGLRHAKPQEPVILEFLE